MSKSVYGLLAAGSDYEQDKQRQSVKTLATMLGLTISDGGYKTEIPGGGAIAKFLEKHTYEGDTVIASSLQSFSDSPLEVLRIVSGLQARGIRVLSASWGGEIQTSEMRKYLPAFTRQQEIIEALRKEIAEKDEDLEAQFALFRDTLTKTTMEFLRKRGVSLGELLRDKPTEADDAQPELGHQIKMQRQSLGLSQSAVGAMCDPKISVSEISRVEKTGSGKAYEAIRDALNLEVVHRKIAERERNTAIASAAQKPFTTASQALKAAVAKSNDVKSERVNEEEDYAAYFASEDAKRIST